MTRQSNEEIADKDNKVGFPPRLFVPLNEDAKYGIEYWLASDEREWAEEFCTEYINIQEHEALLTEETARCLVIDAQHNQELRDKVKELEEAIDNLLAEIANIVEDE